jgi:hypothetical protein
MPNPIELISLAEFEDLVNDWMPLRIIDAIHLHSTGHTDDNPFRGRPSIEAMRRYHQKIGLSDIAQHITIDRDGLIWTGRSFDAIPASIRGHNGTSRTGPFMICLAGDFASDKQRLEGSQLKTGYAVVRAVLTKFSLTEQAIQVHRELAKAAIACPGAAFNAKEFRAEIRKLLKSNTLRSYNVRVPHGVERGSPGRSTQLPTLSTREPDYLEVPESSAALAEQRVLAELIERGEITGDCDGSARGDTDDYRDLLGHVINTSQGILSGRGAMRTTTADLDILIRDHLTPQFESGAFKHLMFYAHGGLVSEASALRYARTMLPWWKSHGVYPIFFVWESGLFDTIWNRPRGGRGLDDFWDKGVEIATQALARGIWAKMKANARRCSEQMTMYGQPGGLFEFAERLAVWLAARKGKVQLHAIGHSTGPILLARFMPLLIDRKYPFQTLNYLAPAIRTDDFENEAMDLVGKGVNRLRVFAMSDKAERDDNVIHIFRKSLLYYVRNACEDTTDGRILGLQRDLLENQPLAKWFGLAGNTPLRGPATYSNTEPIAIEFSQREHDRPHNERTRATTHGGFDDDEATIRSVLANIYGDPADVPSTGDRFPSEQTFDAARDHGESARSFADDADTFESRDVCPCCGHKPERGASAFDSVNEEQDAYARLRLADEAIHDNRPSPASQVLTSGPRSERIAIERRRAVCIGVDTYPTKPLEGCVNDSEVWEALLKKSKFDVQTLRNAKATRANILSALESLVRESRRGDELVFQYAGHGTQVEDLNGDEVDRFDEALVPVDYESGQLLIDDDIYEVCATLKRKTDVTLTFFMDCCNSGSNTRAAIAPTGGAGQRVRYLQMPRGALVRYKELRGQNAASRSPVSERVPIPGVVSFAACLDHESAFETNGRGDFTTKAAAVFDTMLGRGATNSDFIRTVVRAFGANRRQTPLMLDPADGLKTRAFLGGR